MEKVLTQVLQAQATEQLPADPYERTADRQGYRNGTRARKLTTRVGTLTLRIPQIREGHSPRISLPGTSAGSKRWCWP